IILADEPTGNLDYKTTQEIMHILKKETEKFQTSILMATHDLSLLNFADRALILRDGQLVNYDSQNSQIFFT
ncbi:MAG: ABC transporter ATP-binding protein, partial [Gammaproteobacteria bacterium]|nr:ABC transporter ATP-binding protein [Gammaproteobacteria bacterium]